VIARAPSPGRSKTRLCPPCTPEQAADLARAALEDTLAAVAATPADRRVLALDGSPGNWLPGSFEWMPQRGEGLDERLAAAFSDAGAPALVIGMDTPQVTPSVLAGALDLLESPASDAVLGPAHDGGYWAIGLRRADPRIFAGVPMSTAHTAEAQLAQLTRLDLTTELLPELRDVDYFEDARAVAAQCRGSRFHQAFEQLLASGAGATPHRSGEAVSFG
jgi:rSAM/selenodomain-associated transferase 1